MAHAVLPARVSKKLEGKPFTPNILLKILGMPAK
jgi:hypothetical protein